MRHDADDDDDGRRVIARGRHGATVREDAWKRMMLEREQERGSQDALNESSAVKRQSEDAEESEQMDVSDDESCAEEDNESIRVPQATAEQEVMSQLMGFTSFDTMKSKKPKRSDRNEEAPATGEEGAVQTKSRRKYRQYMNRRGGFNRPLSPVF